MAGSLALEVVLRGAPGLWEGSPVAVEPGDALVAIVEALEVEVVKVDLSTCSKGSSVLNYVGFYTGIN